MVMRLGLLAAIAWVNHLVKPLFYLLEHPVSARDLILFFGGIFLFGNRAEKYWDRFMAVPMAKGAGYNPISVS